MTTQKQRPTSEIADKLLDAWDMGCDRDTYICGADRCRLLAAIQAALDAERAQQPTASSRDVVVSEEEIESLVRKWQFSLSNNEYNHLSRAAYFKAGFRAAMQMRAASAWPSEIESKQARVLWAENMGRCCGIEEKQVQQQKELIGRVPWDECYRWLRKRMGHKEGT